MHLSRRQQRRLRELEQQLSHDDPELALWLGDPRQRRLAPRTRRRRVAGVTCAAISAAILALAYGLPVPSLIIWVWIILTVAVPFWTVPPG